MTIEVVIPDKMFSKLSKWGFKYGKNINEMISSLLEASLNMLDTLEKMNKI